MVSQPNTPHANLKDILKRLDQIRPEALSTETLRQMQAKIHTGYTRLVARGLEEEKSANEAIENSDPSVLKRIKVRSSRLQKELEELEELDHKLENCVHRKIIRDTMISRLGSRHMLLALEVIVMTLIVVVLGLLIYDTSAGPDSERHAWLSSDSIFIIDAVCCLIFMAEFFFRLSCAESKKFVWRHHWIDFITSIPIPGEAQLARFGRVARLARFARILRLLRFLRFLRLFFLLWRGMDKLQDVIDVKLMKKTLRWAVMVTLMGALLVYRIEGTPAPPAPDSTVAVETQPTAAVEENAVSSYPLALWWSFTTVVTGGFGDIHNPETPGGQVLTAILIVTGMVLVGVFTATLTSLFIGEQAEEIEKLQEELSQRLDQLANRIENRDGPDSLEET